MRLMILLQLVSVRGVSVVECEAAAIESVRSEGCLRDCSVPHVAGTVLGEVTSKDDVNKVGALWDERFDANGPSAEVNVVDGVRVD